MAVKSRNIMTKLVEAERRAAITWLENAALLAPSESEQAIHAKYALGIIKLQDEIIKNQVNSHNNLVNTIVGQSNTIVSQGNIIKGQSNFIKGQRTVAKLQDDIIKCQDASITALMVDALHVAA